MIGYQNNEFLNTHEIVIPADSTASNRGVGAFDFFGVINGKGFYQERHLDRFFSTVKLMRLSIKESRKQVEEILHKLINLNENENFYIKLFAYPLDSFEGRLILSEFIALPITIKPADRFNHHTGVNLITKEYQRFLPEAKSTNYLPLVYWQEEIRNAGAVDVLYFSDNEVRETSRGNIFIVKGDIVTTPSEKILKGITRSVVLDILKEHNICYKEGSISLEMLYEADEVFLSSTTTWVLPVVQINDTVFSRGKPGVLTKRIFNYFVQLKEGWNL